MAMKEKKRVSRWVWGVFWLLIATLILSNYFGGFVELGVWSVIVAALALLILFQCLATLSFAPVPIPLAALYYVFQIPVGLPFVPFWTMVLVALLVTCGLHVLLPRKFWHAKQFEFTFNDNKRHYRRDNSDENEASIEEGDDVNNPYVNASFGSASRYLHSDRLETLELNCNCGALEVFLDNVQLHPDGAEAFVNCRLGAVELYVPGDWRIIDNINVSLGASDVDGRLRGADPDAPTLTLNGNVSLGAIEVRRIKGDYRGRRRDND